MMYAVTALVCSLMVLQVDAGYFISAPRTVLKGIPYDVSVDILNVSSVDVTVSLTSSFYNTTTRQSDVRTESTASGNFGMGASGVVSLPIPEDFECSSCRLHVRGRNGLQFERQIYTSVSGKVVSVLVQTDKAIYKPSHTVRFRAFAVYPDLQLYTGAFNIEIRDPNRNKIKILSNLSSSSGVVEGSLELSDQPLFGTWQIYVNLEDLRDSTLQSFEVADYELPRFEITVDLPPFALTTDDKLSGSVKAMYTFGQPVKGRVEIHVGPNVGPNSCGDPPKTTQVAFEIDGEADFSFPRADVQRAVSIYNGREVKVTAFVTEDATGVTLNGTSTLKYYYYKHQLKFLENTPNVFKPGLPYTAYIQATTPDDMPPTGGPHVINVYTYVTYRETVPDQGFYGTSQFTGTYPLPGQNLTLPTNGILPVEIEIPKNATSIHIKATFGTISTSKTVEKTYSKSNNFIQLSLLDKNVQSRSQVTFRLDATEELNSSVTYEILSRGSVEEVGSIAGQGSTSLTFTINVTPAMAPTAHIIAYYARGSDEIVADSLAFNVEGIFENQVSISFSKNESEPNKQVHVEVTADPDSQVNVLTVDQSVLLLKKGNDITPEKVEDAVSAFDNGRKPTDSEFALSYSSKSTQDVFSETGLLTLTDLDITPPPVYGPYYPPSYSGYPSPPGYPELAGYPSTPGMPSAPGSPAYPSAMPSPPGDSGSSLKEVERVRNLFPETWIWASKQTNRGNGKAIIQATVPDTITSWVASAFATNPVSGLGVAPTTSKLKVFRPFFVNLNYPSSVTRGEQAVVQATVFNYLPSDLTVTVTLKGSSKFQSVEVISSGMESLSTGDQVKQVQVASEEQGVVYFPIYLSEIGLVDIEVAAQTNVSADAVRRKIDVKAEGAPVSFNYPIFINLDGNNSVYDDRLDFPLPLSTVQGSEDVRMKVTGDLIGASLDSLSGLLRLPTGCGEQSMVKFAPDLYIAQYLKATGQLTTSLSSHIVRLLEQGYQRQLAYQRYDGGFSAFGNLDESGSTWLTAYVARSFYEARDFIYVDPSMLTRAVDWLVDRQNLDGSFSEFGKVLDSSMQGSGTGPALTSFVLLAFLQNRDLAPVDTCHLPGNSCYRPWRYGNATQKATRNLEGLVTSDAIDDQFSLSLVSYALSQANSPLAADAFAKLSTYSNVEGGLLYWGDNATVSQSQTSRFLVWQPPRVQARPIDILITSYAILYYTAIGDLDAAYPAVRWLTAQRNANGGFASSQDTTVGLQALAAFATQSIRSDTNLRITLTEQTELANFHVTKNNALTLQIQPLDNPISQADLHANGNGFALVEIEYGFNVNEELSTPSFDVSTVLLDDDIDSFNLMICTKWLWDRDTGMVVQEVGIPSGFNPDLDSLDNVAGLKRRERRGDTVDIYFDKITKSSICYSIMMTRTGKVARSQKSYVRTYDYYQPGDQSTVFYNPRKLKESTICDVCDGCCL